MKKLMSCGLNLVVLGLMLCAVSCCLLTGGIVKAGDPPVAQVTYLPPVAVVDSTPVRVPFPPVAVVAEKPVVPTVTIRKSSVPVVIAPYAGNSTSNAVPRSAVVPASYNVPNNVLPNNYYPQGVSRPANPFLVAGSIPITNAIGAGQVNMQSPGSMGMVRIPTFVIGAGIRGDTNGCPPSG